MIGSTSLPIIGDTSLLPPSYAVLKDPSLYNDSVLILFFIWRLLFEPAWKKGERDEFC
jgi:hypothetical protein